MRTRATLCALTPRYARPNQFPLSYQFPNNFLIKYAHIFSHGFCIKYVMIFIVVLLSIKGVLPCD